MSSSEHDEQSAPEMTERVERVALTPGLERSLAAIPAAELDVAAADLLRRYASLLDDAVAADKWTRALRLVSEAVDEASSGMHDTMADQLRSAWGRIEQLVAEHSVASDLGPKYLAALTALGLTPAGRGLAKQPKGGESATVEQLPSALTLLRGGAAERNAGAR